jgi:membrane-associated phospholipid phosphatase
MGRSPRKALVAAALCLAAFALTGLVALLLPAAQVHDSATLAGFASLEGTRAQQIAGSVANLVDANRYMDIAFVFALIALLRRRPRLALLIPLVMFAATASADTLKPLLAEPRHWSGIGGGGEMPGSWPSGHATASMMVALGAVQVVPKQLRAATALAGIALAIAVGYSVLVLAWHFPSDVIGGFLLAGLFTSLELALLWWSHERWPARSGRRAVIEVTNRNVTVVAAWLFAGGVAVALVLGHADIHDAYLVAHGSFLVGVALIAALAAVLVSALSAML